MIFIEFLEMVEEIFSVEMIDKIIEASELPIEHEDVSAGKGIAVKFMLTPVQERL
jgi:hypothetical protein